MQKTPKKVYPVVEAPRKLGISRQAVAGRIKAKQSTGFDHRRLSMTATSSCMRRRYGTDYDCLSFFYPCRCRRPGRGSPDFTIVSWAVGEATLRFYLAPRIRISAVPLKQFECDRITPPAEFRLNNRPYRLSIASVLKEKESHVALESCRA